MHAMSDSAVVLETHNLSKYFGGLHAVEDVSLRVADGHFHSIIGPNGAGKTTLFNLLSGVLKPSAGQVLLRGQDITDLPPYRIASLGIGRSYQITNIFPSLTVFENVRLAAQALGKDNFQLFTPASHFREYEEKAIHALEQTGLTGVASAVALSLSHGDKRKLEVAILLAQNPAILLLDEPTAGLASEQVPEFMDLIARIRQEGGKTIVLVEHNMGVVMSLSDRISVMHQGRLLAEGTPSEIANNPLVQSAYLGELYGDLDGMITG
jgi:branched-chain amino acid transport system ATP-binding protein